MLLRLLLILLLVFALLLVARLLRGAPSKRRRRPWRQPSGPHVTAARHAPTTCSGDGAPHRIGL